MVENIFLIGFMGAGKSYLGKRLAKRIGYSFIDTDFEIEKETQYSIAELFNLKGEKHFRKIETEWLKKFNNTKTIIALGGGLPCFNNNSQLINQKGKSIYLNIEPSFLVKRLQKSKTVRPLIEPFKENTPKLLTFITNKLNDREPYYKKATYTINGENKLNQKISEIIELISTT